MKVHNPSEIASLLGVKESTLRKYSLLLEECGYKFQRNNQNQRWYRDEDVIALRKFVSLKNNGDMTLKECAEAVFLGKKGKDVTLPSTVTHNVMERYDNDMNELKELIHKQNEMLGELSNRLDKQQEYIDNRLKERDQLLMDTLKNSLETQKQIASAEEQKKGFFSWLKRKS